MSAVSLNFHSTSVWQHSSSLPACLQKIGMIVEKWDVQDVSLSGVDLKSPTEGFIAQLLGGDRLQVQRVYDFRTPDGSIDLIHLSPETAGLDALLDKFKVIHDHEAPEIRLILEGEGVFYIYTEDGEKHDILVEKGTFLFLPANIAHNFTLIDKKTVTALRVFQDKDGWVARPR